MINWKILVLSVSIGLLLNSTGYSQSLEGSSVTVLLEKLSKDPAIPDDQKPPLILNLKSSGNSIFETKDGTPKGYRSVYINCQDGLDVKKGNLVKLTLRNYTWVDDIESFELGKKPRAALMVEKCEM